MSETKNLWGGRFTGGSDAGFAEFNRSFPFDRRLFRADARASIAHAEALHDAGVLTDEEARAITDGLRALVECEASDSSFLEDAAAEDVHSFIESRLVELIGEAGRKLHTGRSRNDQVATAFRLWLRDEIGVIDARARDAQAALLDLADRHRAAVVPGYTHLQRAQPVLFAPW